MAASYVLKRPLVGLALCALFGSVAALNLSLPAILLVAASGLGITYSFFFRRAPSAAVYLAAFTLAWLHAQIVFEASCSIGVDLDRRGEHVEVIGVLPAPPALNRGGRRLRFSLKLEGIKRLSHWQRTSSTVQVSAELGPLSEPLDLGQRVWLRGVLKRSAQSRAVCHLRVASNQTRILQMGDVVDVLVAAVGLKPDGIDFDALDQQPSKIFILTICPEKRSGPHIQFLAKISRLLSRPEIRERVLGVSTKDELIELLSEAD